MFCEVTSNHGPKRIQCLTHDTKKAETTAGLFPVCSYLFSAGLKYVCLREIQSDRNEREFSVYSQYTGANALMLVYDVFTAHKNLLARFTASHLESLENNDNYISNQHECSGISLEDADAIETCVSEVTLTGTEENAVCSVGVGLVS